MVNKVSDLPFFTTGLLAADDKLVKIRLQLSRWVKDGRVIKINKGMYTLARPYRKVDPEPFTVANALKSPSYVSLQSALSWHGLIPEFVPVTTSVTTARPQLIETPLGSFEYRHVKTGMFQGYAKIRLSGRQDAFVASSEKAILDLVHLTPGADSYEYLKELRLQNMDVIDMKKLQKSARNAGSPKLQRAAENIIELAADSGVDQS
ncbi:MAG: hypothetical protein GF417_13000 [Candidatus Latescibacteria bacterium]|nr:hypothetical protein [Candidatus Latescibacterota bacterium]